MIFVIMIYDIQTESNTHGNMLKLGRKYLHHIQKSCFHGYLSYKKVGKLEKELEELKLVRRPEIVERIKIARSYGDLSENSEYEAAKDEQAFVEGQISSIETKIRYAEIVNSDSVAKDEVAIGKTVTIQEVGETDKEVYQIVGAAGADAFANKVSNESPIGQALIGKKKGDTVTVQTPAGSYDIKILKVEKTK